jgi:hypothetical protein
LPDAIATRVLDRHAAVVINDGYLRLRCNGAGQVGVVGR